MEQFACDVDASLDWVEASVDGWCIFGNCTSSGCICNEGFVHDKTMAYFRDCGLPSWGMPVIFMVQFAVTAPCIALLCYANRYDFSRSQLKIVKFVAMACIFQNFEVFSALLAQIYNVHFFIALYVVCLGLKISTLESGLFQVILTIVLPSTRFKERSQIKFYVRMNSILNPIEVFCFLMVGAANLTIRPGTFNTGVSIIIMVLAIRGLWEALVAYNLFSDFTRSIRLIMETTGKKYLAKDRTESGKTRTESGMVEIESGTELKQTASRIELDLENLLKRASVARIVVVSCCITASLILFTILGFHIYFGYFPMQWLVFASLCITVPGCGYGMLFVAMLGTNKFTSPQKVQGATVTPQ